MVRRMPLTEKKNFRWGKIMGTSRLQASLAVARDTYSMSSTKSKTDYSARVAYKRDNESANYEKQI